MARTVFRICPLCEATCNLELRIEGRKIELARGDRDDVFSRGFICPKGSALGHLESDPDRIVSPRIRDRKTNTWRDVDYDEAFAYIDAHLPPLLEANGRDSVAVYMGNPSAHNIGPQVYNKVLIRAVKTRNIFSASTVDQMPRQVASGYLFGSGLSVPIADIDHTDYLLILGANPFASNGSLMTAPDFPGRLRALRARGGKFVVIDPRRTKTAEEANEWIPIAPGTDALFLLAIANVLFAYGLADPGVHVMGFLSGLDEIRELVAPFTPEAVSGPCGIEAEVTRRIAQEISAAPSAAVYGRIGTTTTEFGTTTSWAVDLINILTGNLDRRGGAMFNLPAVGGGNSSGAGGKGRGFKSGRRTSRVKGHKEVFGEMPAATLPDEIEAQGEGQVRVAITVSGNPVVSNPNSQRLDKALASLDFMVSLDIYCNETTRHADVIIPPESLLARGHYDLALRSLAIRNVAHYSPPAVGLEPNEYPEWRSIVRLAAIVSGLGHSDDVVDQLDDMVLRDLVNSAVGREGRLAGRDVDSVMAELSPNGRRGPERFIDLMLRTGPYGDQLTIDKLASEPHGVDLGPLEPRLPGVLRTASGTIELAAEPIVADVKDRLSKLLDADASAATEMKLIGRRDLRSNNSWMHNIRVLVKGKPRCTLQVNPADATRLGLGDGKIAKVQSAAGSVEIAVEITDTIMSGVVSIPHGWGHDVEGTEMSVARDFAGVNSNILARSDLLDPLSGTSVLNGIPVEVAPV